MLSFLACWCLGIIKFILVADQIRHNIRFTYIDQKTVSNYYRPLKLGKCSISFSKISNFILSLEWIELNIKLSSLVVIATAHHWVDWWLLDVFAHIRIIRVVHWNNEIIHLLLQQLLTRCVFDITSSGTMSIFRAFLIIFIVFGAIFDPKVAVSIEFLSSGAIFVIADVAWPIIEILLIW